MKIISFDDSEVKTLVDLYETEIAKAQYKITNLQSILKKLQGDAGKDQKVVSRKKVKQAVAAVKKAEDKPVTDKVAAPVKKNAKEKPAIKKEAVVAQKVKVAKKSKAKRPVAKNTAKAKTSKYKSIKGEIGGEKVKWSDTIVRILNEKGAPMLSSDISKEAIARLGIPEENVARAKSAVATNITKLIKNNKISKKSVDGKKGSLFEIVK